MKSVLFEAPMLSQLMVVGDDLLFARTDNFEPAIYHMAPGRQARAITRPGELSLVTVEDHRMIGHSTAGALVAIDLRTLAATTLCHLAPSPIAVALTPEQIIWCTQDTREMTGRGPHEAGQLWRWWRGADGTPVGQPELLGEHPGSMPELAVAARTPIARSAMTSPVYFAADRQLGVIDERGLRWIAAESQGFANLVASHDALYYTTQSRVVRRSLAGDDARTIYQTTIPLALALSPDNTRLAVSRNVVYDRGNPIEDSALVIVDLASGGSAMLAREIGRPCELATDALGIYIVEDAIEREHAQLTFVPWIAEALRRSPAEPS